MGNKTLIRHYSDFLLLFLMKKNGLTCIGKPFFVVAEAGFEPTTFGLVA